MLGCAGDPDSGVGRHCLADVAQVAVLRKNASSLHTMQQAPRRKLWQRGLDRPPFPNQHQRGCSKLRSNESMNHVAMRASRQHGSYVLSGLRAWPLSKRHESCARTAFLGARLVAGLPWIATGHGTATGYGAAGKLHQHHTH